MMRLSSHLMTRAVTCAFNLCMIEDLKMANDCYDLLRTGVFHSLKGRI